MSANGSRNGYGLASSAMRRLASPLPDSLALKMTGLPKMSATSFGTTNLSFWPPAAVCELYAPA
jgi:hypothetical protein